MDAVKPIRGIQVKEHEMEYVRQIEGVAVKDIVTKYFFKDNVLCFQILLHIEGGQTILYQEFNNYTEYKNALDYLHDAREKSAIIKIPKNIVKSGAAALKVA